MVLEVGKFGGVDFLDLQLLMYMTPEDLSTLIKDDSLHTRCIAKTIGFTRGVCVKIGDLLNLKVFLWNS